MAQHKALMLGLGFWGQRWMQALTASDKCDVAGISGDKDGIEMTSAKFGISKHNGYESYGDAIEKTNADIAIIALPTRFHADAARLALSKGMNVISEKPLSIDIDIATEIVEVKKKYPVLKAMVSQNYRWRPHNQTMKNAILEGMIGDIGSIHVEFRQPECLIGYREFLEQPLLQDMSIHHFDLIRFFTSKSCEEILASSYRPSWSIYEGMPSTEAIIHMQDNVVVNYNSTWAARGRITSWDGDITVTGDKGCLRLDVGNTVRFFGPNDEEGRVIENMDMKLTELDYCLDMFVRSIEDDTKPECDLEDNLQSFAMVCAAEESVRTRAWVSIG